MPSIVNLSTGIVYLAPGNSISLNSIALGAASGTYGTLGAISNGVWQFLNNAGTGWTRTIFGTNDATNNGFSLGNSSGTVIVSTGDGTALAAFKAQNITVGAGNMVLNGSTGKAQVYGGATTAGQGLTTIYAAGRSAGATGAVSSVATYTVGGSDSSFEVSANILVTAASTCTFTATCTYTDEGSTSRTLTLPFTLVAGSAIVNTVANANGTVPYMGIVQHIRAKASTTITIATTGTFTSVTYNVEGNIRQIA